MIGPHGRSSIQVYIGQRWLDTQFVPRANQDWFRLRLERSGGRLGVYVNGLVQLDVPNTQDFSPLNPETGLPVLPALRIGAAPPDTDYDLGHQPRSVHSASFDTNGFAGLIDNFVITSARLNA